MNKGLLLAMLAILPLFLGCQPVHVEATAFNGIQPICRSYRKDGDVWIEAKLITLSEKNDWEMTFNGIEIPYGFNRSNDKVYTLFNWRVKRADGKIERSVYIVKVASDGQTRKIAVRVNSQGAWAFLTMIGAGAGGRFPPVL